MISVADARREAKRLKAEITLGADPRAEAKARRAVMTYAEFFEPHVLPHLSRGTALGIDWTRLYRLRLKSAFGGTRVDQISRHQIQCSTRCSRRWASRRRGHHHLVLRYSLNLARQWGLLEGENPAAGIQMPFDDNGSSAIWTRRIYRGC